VAVWIKAFEGGVLLLVVRLNDLHTVGLKTAAQRPDIVGSGKAEAEMQEGRRLPDDIDGVEGEIEAVGVAHDDRAVGVALRRRRVEVEVPLVEVDASSWVGDREAEMIHSHPITLPTRKAATTVPG
jgi:hypothetical protein